jgi:hypothetical protein
MGHMLAILSRITAKERKLRKGFVKDDPAFE